MALSRAHSPPRSNSSLELDQAALDLKQYQSPKDDKIHKRVPGQLLRWPISHLSLSFPCKGLSDPDNQQQLLHKLQVEVKRRTGILFDLDNMHERPLSVVSFVSYSLDVYFKGKWNNTVKKKTREDTESSCWCWILPHIRICQQLTSRAIEDQMNLVLEGDCLLMVDIVII